MWKETAEDDCQRDPAYLENFCCDTQFLAYFYLEGAVRVQPNYVEAVKWLLKCPNSEFGYAEFSLAKCYFYGFGVVQDYAEAARWLLEALLNTDAAPHEEIGFLLCRVYTLSNADLTSIVKTLAASSVKERSWQESYAETANGSREAANAGKPWAQFEMCLAYSYGRGVPHDYIEAAKWLHKAADAGYVLAQFHLAEAYIKGRGVPQDFIQAHLWFNLAASGSVGELQEYASKARDELGFRMTPPQIAEAQLLARQWSPREVTTGDEPQRNTNTIRLMQALQKSLGELPRNL